MPSFLHQIPGLKPKEIAAVIIGKVIGNITGGLERNKIKRANAGSSMMNDFMAQISKSSGIAHQNRYEIRIPIVSLADVSNKILTKVNAKTPELEAFDWMEDFYDADLHATSILLTAFCDKAELPSYQFQLETVRHYGPSFKIPHMPEYQDVTFTFLCGDNMWERYFFDAWMYTVMDPRSNNFNYKSEYALNIDIVSYDQQGKCNYYTTMVDAFPISINQQELGYEMNNTVQKVSVTFSYKFLTPYEGKGSSTSLPMRGQQQSFTQTVSSLPF